MEFGDSLSRKVEEGIAADIHTIVPALGVPSDITRIVDGISTKSGESLFAILYLLTGSEGRLQWRLLDLPNTATRPARHVDRRVQARRPLPRFGFHGAARLGALTHHTEAKYQVHDADRLLRLALNVGDGALEGPGSMGMAQHEATVMGTQWNPTAARSCDFHAADHAGHDADRASPLALAFDQYLRLVRRHFAYGNGLAIGRAVAREFQRLIDNCSAEVCSAERGAPVPVHASRCGTTAANLCRLRWHCWQVPLAPQVGGTRKIVYASNARLRFFRIFPLVYWALLVRMQEVREQARLASARAGHTPGRSAGARTAPMRQWCSMGRTLLNIQLMVFGMGRANFRDAFLIRFTRLTQTSLHVGTARFREALRTSEDMLRGIGDLVALRGHVLFLGTLFKMYHLRWHVHHFPAAATSPVTDAPGQKFTTKTLSLIFATLAAHSAWRTVPLLCKHLPEVLIAGTMRGVSVDTTVFAQADDVGADLPQRRHGVAGSEQVRERREHRFREVVDALDALIAWAKEERRSYLQRLFGFRLPTRSRLSAVLQRQEHLPDAHLTPDREISRQIQDSDPLLALVAARRVPVQATAAGSAAAWEVPCKRRSGGSAAAAAAASPGPADSGGGGEAALLACVSVPEEQLTDEAAVDLERFCASVKSKRIPAVHRDQFVADAFAHWRRPAAASAGARSSVLNTNLSDNELDPDDVGGGAARAPAAPRGAAAQPQPPVRPQPLASTPATAATDAQQGRHTFPAGQRWMVRSSLHKNSVVFLPGRMYDRLLEETILRSKPDLVYREHVADAFGNEALWATCRVRGTSTTRRAAVCGGGRRPPSPARRCRARPRSSSGSARRRSSWSRTNACAHGPGASGCCHTRTGSGSWIRSRCSCNQRRGQPQTQRGVRALAMPAAPVRYEMPDVSASTRSSCVVIHAWGPR